MSIRVQHIRGTTAEIEGVTPQVAELGFDTSKKEPHIGDGATSGGVRMQKKNTREILTPAQIVANTNDYSPSGLKHAAAMRLSTDASRNLTGIVPTTVTDTTDGRHLTLYNAGSFNLVVQDQNAASLAANRLDLGGADITLAPKQSLTLRYSNGISRWEISENNFGQAIADGAVSARKLAISSLGAFSGMINGTLVESHTGGAATFAIKTLAGVDPSPTDPVFFVFRDVTAATGDFVVRTVTSALSLTLSSGSSMGFSSVVAGKLWLSAIDNGGAVLLGAINCLNGNDIFPLGGFNIISTTAEGGAGAADNAATMYAASAVSSKAYAILGYASYETGLASAGIWAASPTRLQLYGPGVPLPGQIVQSVVSQLGTNASGTTTIPSDDTIPQNTEGDQYLSKSITPSSAAHMLRVRSQLMLSNSAASQHIQAALFQDTTANALAAIDVFQATATEPVAVPLQLRLLAALTTSTTFKVRAGGGSAGTTTFNGGAGSARLYLGVANSFIEVEELAT